MSDGPTNKVFLPGATIGMFGSGQLGRMFTMAAKQMGYRVHVFSDAKDSPAGQVADVEVVADFNDPDAVKRFAQQVDVVTLEFENVPVETIRVASQFVPVRPGQQVLETTQHRLREKMFLQDNEIPVARFTAVHCLEELQTACRELLPGVLKTATMGYDGKGQIVIRQGDELEAAWNALQTDQAILEELVDLESEFSVVAARNAGGEFTAFPAITNVHRNHILDVSVSPSGLSPQREDAANTMAREIMDRLDVVGVLCVEFFLLKDGRLLVNELAPRPHNSGHLTIDAHATDQFEQQVRAVCGLSLGSTLQLKPAAMVNLLGECWEHGDPDWAAALKTPETRLHLYGKSQPRPDRKMGHITSLAETVEEARRRALASRSKLTSATDGQSEAKSPIAEIGSKATTASG